MTAVTSCLLEVQGARIFISNATRECRVLRDNAKLPTNLPASSPIVVELDNGLADVTSPKNGTSWLQRIFQGKSRQSSIIKPM